MERDGDKINADIVNLVNMFGLLIITLSKDRNEHERLNSLRSFLFSVSTFIIFFVFLVLRLLNLSDINNSSAIFLPICVLFTYLVVFNFSKKNYN